MTQLRDLLEEAVADGVVPGAAALVARGDEVEVASAGDLGPDAIVRIASITKPITAAAVMLLVEDGRMALDDPIARWLPELTSPRVVRTPESPVDDVVPAARPITVGDLLTFRAGWGFPSDFSLPAVVELFEEAAGVRAAGDAGRVARDARRRSDAAAARRGVALQHLLGHPGRPDRAGLGAAATRVPRRARLRTYRHDRHRLLRASGEARTSCAVPRPRPLPGRRAALDRAARLPSGSGGLLSTLADWHRFGRMLLAGGGALLSRSSVRLMTTDHLTQAQRDASTLFLEGAGWGFGGSVEADGRYGWVGGTGTTAHVAPPTGRVGVLLTQVPLTGPTPPPLMRRFWQVAFDASWPPHS